MTSSIYTVTINGISGQFDADSGSFFSMLSHETAERLKLRVEPLPGNLQVRGASGVADVGMTHVKEGVEQLRGTAINQVEGAELALVTGGPAAIPMSATILKKA